MTDYHKQIAQSIVSAILADLRGRSGIGNALEDVDPEVREELEQSLVSKTTEALRSTDLDVERVVTIELAHQDAVRIAKQLPYAKIGDTVIATAPDGTGIRIEIRSNK